MCGIAGAIRSDRRVLEQDVLRSMLSVMAHRGPDGTGIQIHEDVGLAHTRLSIIDIEGGAQPMSVEDDRLWITFNGEIFNYLELREELRSKGHQFKTQSDTEVILRLYIEKGEECVEDLNGQWAFAIWDRAKDKLFLSRDRLGVRPLFYTITQGDFVFASEIKALHRYPGVARQIDLQALDQIFTFWVTIPPRTIFRNILQLPPGHSMVVEQGRITIRKYWEPQYAAGGNEFTGPRASEQLLALLEDATRIRLRADVPVGAYLSGGIDSTFITALTRKIAQNHLRTFSVGFEAPDFDESRYQSEASRFLKTDHRQVHCTNHQIAECFPKVVWHAEQPILRTAPAPLFILSNCVHEDGFKVVVTGEGSDEIFGGYDIFKEAKIRHFWAKMPDSQIRPLLLRRLYPYLENIQRQPQSYLQQFFRVHEGDLKHPFFSHLPRWELTAKIKQFFSADTKSFLTDYDSVSGLEVNLPKSYTGWTSFSQAQYLETAHLLPGYILSSQGDRVAMAHSVEGRYPFLDHRVVEFASKLHPNLKMKVLNEKYLLKRCALDMVPESILRRPKQPYRAPDGASFIGPKSPEYVEELLGSAKIREYGIFDADMVMKLYQKFKSSRIVPSTKDNMAFVGVLSTQLLMHSFACGN